MIQNKLENIGIHYCQNGDGTPQVVFIHGLFGCGRNWYSYLKYTYEELGFVSLAPDLRGQGESDSFFNNEGMHQLVEDMHNFLQSICDDKVTLIGHSLGGKIAIMLAAEHPQLFEKVMILDTGLNPINEDIFVILDWLKNLPVPVTERRQARQYLDNLTTDHRLRNFLLTNLKKYDDGYAWRLDIEGLFHVVEDLSKIDLHETWNQIKIPIYLVRGKDSTHLTSEEYHKMSQKDNVTPVEVENAGHWVHADNPEEFQKILHLFLEN